MQSIVSTELLLCYSNTRKGRVTSAWKCLQKCTYFFMYSVRHIFLVLTQTENSGQFLVKSPNAKFKNIRSAAQLCVTCLSTGSRVEGDTDFGTRSAGYNKSVFLNLCETAARYILFYKTMARSQQILLVNTSPIFLSSYIKLTTFSPTVPTSAAGISHVVADVEAPGGEKWERLKSGGKQWQATPNNLPRMQCTRDIPVD